MTVRYHIPIERCWLSMCTWLCATTRWITMMCHKRFSLATYRHTQPVLWLPISSHATTTVFTTARLQRLSYEYYWMLFHHRLISDETFCVIIWLSLGVVKVPYKPFRHSWECCPRHVSTWQYTISNMVSLLYMSCIILQRKCCSDNMDEGYALIKDLAPNTAQEYILKAVALTMVGQEHNSVRV